MSTSESDDLSNIETFVLKVHMNCQGCTNRVRKLLRKIEGVYKVDINEEEQEAIVWGKVDPSTLVKKLVKSGKHAEIWNQEQGTINAEDNENNDLNASENHEYMTPTFFGTGRDQQDQIFESPVFIENEGFGNQEWGCNFSEMSPIDKYFRHPSPTSDIHGYYSNYLPSELMHLNYYI